MSTEKLNLTEETERLRAKVKLLEENVEQFQISKKLYTQEKKKIYLEINSTRK